MPTIVRYFDVRSGMRCRTSQSQQREPQTHAVPSIGEKSHPEMNSDCRRTAGLVAVWVKAAGASQQYTEKRGHQIPAAPLAMNQYGEGPTRQRSAQLIFRLRQRAGGYA